jgi:hypothetical protein
VIEASELADLEATLLPALERHHLRLLAHGLRTLQAAAGRRHGPLPSWEALLAWADQQPQLRSDPAFRAAFLDQLASLGQQLEAIAADPSQGPLALELAQLIAWAQAQAHTRLASSGPLSPPPPPPD